MQAKQSRARIGFSRPHIQQTQQAPMGGQYSAEAKPGKPHEARLQTPPQEYGRQPAGRVSAKILRSSNSGFIVAGVCVTGAALILLFVYFMAIGLSNNTSGGELGTSLAPTVTSSLNSTSTPILTPTASATAIDLPADGFITKAETAGAVDPTTSKAIDPATTFSVNQKIYITLHLHPAGQTSVVCLLWYLDGKETSHSEFSVGPTETVAYSYTIYTQAGAGYVDIYWASTSDCTDKSLAQHVVFNVISG